MLMVSIAGVIESGVAVRNESRKQAHPALEIRYWHILIVNSTHPFEG
jgi:hypothetical protein